MRCIFFSYLISKILDIFHKDYSILKSLIDLNCIILKFKIISIINKKELILSIS